MARFTKDLRQQLIREYAAQHGGVYSPAGFLRDAEDPAHPAHGWFTWDDTVAANQYRLEQARDFARGLRIVFTVMTVDNRPAVVSAPAFVSPLERRDGGGSGYQRFEPDSAESIADLARQAARDLGWWLRRYESSLHAIGRGPEEIRSLIADLESRLSNGAAAA